MSDNKTIKLNFSVDNAKIEEAKDARFTPCIIEAFASGENAHTNEVTLEDLKRNAETIYDIPIVYSYDFYSNDYKSHEKDEVPMGFIKEDKVKNPIKFEEKSDGRVFLKIKGLIWNRFAGNFKNIFAKSDNKKSVSVELTIVEPEEENGKPLMKDFVFNAITVLGDRIRPAVEGANLALAFSADKEIYLEEKTSIKIENTKEAAVNGKWSNPRGKLLNPILKASNKTALLKEAYLVVDDIKAQDIPLSSVHYPHHKVIGDKMVIHISGLQAAYARAEQQHIVEGAVKAHLLRHYHELGLTQENFANFGITNEQFEQYFAITIGKEEDDLKKMENMQIENAKSIEVAKEKEEDDLKKMENMQIENAKSIEVAKEEEDFKCKFAEMEAKCQALQAKNDSFMSKIAEMSDYEELKKFKEETLAKERMDKELAEMNKVMESLTVKGIEMSEENRTEMFAKRDNFENVDAWSNYVKAFAFDNFEVKDKGIIKFEIPNITETNNSAETHSIWQKLKNNLK